MASTPLHGITVLELPSGLGGAYATKLLRDLGAHVVLVEPPDGHPLRRWTASAALPSGSDGPLFRFLAAGKHSVCADLDDPADRAALLALATHADVVVCGPGSLAAQLRAAAPAAAVVALSPFGLQGPWAGRAATELTVQALSGGPAHRGAPGSHPISVGGQHGEWVVGTFAAVGALTALFRRAAGGAGGAGELVDVSMLEALVMTPHFNAITYRSIAGSAYFEGRRPRYPGDIEPTADGYVGFALVNTLQPWLDFCALIGHDDWAANEAWHNPTVRAEHHDELIGDIRAWTSARTTDEVVELASLLRIPVAPIGNGANVTAMEHFVQRRFFQRSADGTMVQPSPAFRFDAALPDEVAPPVPPLGPRLRPPEPGAFVPPAAQDAASAEADSAPPALPFTGLRILDLTAFWAGPFATHLPALLGAEVIHVESARRPDGARSITVRNADPARWWEWSHAFQGVNTNKLGLSLDLSTEAGRSVLRRILATCDAVVENFSPRVLDGWGLDEASIRAIRPDIAIVRMPAFGLDGPWRDRVGFAMTMEQISGLAWMTGPADGPPVTLLGPCDPVGGAHGTVALLAALWERRRTGTGRLVEVPMVAGALNLAAEQVCEHSANGVLLRRDGNRGPAAAPQNLYRCADPPLHGEDRFVAVAVATDEQWLALRAALGDPAWAADPVLATMAGRHAAHDSIDAGLGAWCATRSAAEIVEALWPAGVPVAPVLTTGELADLPPLPARGFLEEVEHPVTGRSLHTTYPAWSSAGPARWNRRAAPVLGRDNREVLIGMVGLTEAELAELEATGVLDAELQG